MSLPEKCVCHTRAESIKGRSSCAWRSALLGAGGVRPMAGDATTCDRIHRSHRCKDLLEYASLKCHCIVHALM